MVYRLGMVWDVIGCIWDANLQLVPVPFQHSMEVLKALDSRMGHCRSLRSGVALSDALVPPYTPEEVDACEVYACSRHVGSALPVKSWKMRVKLIHAI